LIAFAPRALQQIEHLREHYDRQERYEATDALEAALAEAVRKIEANPAAGLPAPRPYPQLARPGRAWVKAGRYWIAYRTTPRLVIAAVFFETSNIPGRL
jgi:plasmid stabilization system protein ParE